MKSDYELSPKDKKKYNHRVLELAKLFDSHSDDYVLGHLDACLNCAELFDLDYTSLLTLQIVINACYISLERRGKL